MTGGHRLDPGCRRAAPVVAGVAEHLERKGLLATDELDRLLSDATT